MRIFLILAVLLLPSWAWGVTWYIQKSDHSANTVMYKSGAWPLTYNAEGVTDNTSIDNILRFVGAAGDTFNIDGGTNGLTYSGTELSASGAITNVAGNGKIIQGSALSGYSGQVSLSGVSASTASVTISTASDTVWNRIKFTGAVSGQYQLVSSKSAIFNDCIIGDSPGRAFNQSATGTTITMNRCTIRNNLDTARTATLATGATLNLNYPLYYNNAANLNIAASTLNINNGVFAGNHATLQPILDFGGIATSTISNTIFSGNITKRTNKHIIANAAGASVTVKNSVLQPHPVQPTVYGYQNIVDGGGNIYNSPAVKNHYGGKALVAIGSDTDARAAELLPGGSSDTIVGLMQYANSRGVPVYMALERPDRYTESDWNTVRSWEAAGNEAHVHTMHHFGMTDSLTIGPLKFVGPAGATISITVNRVAPTNSATWTGTLTCKVSGGTVLTVDISANGTYPEVYGLTNYINAQLGGSGWSVTPNNPVNNQGLLCTTLTPVTDLAVSGAGASVPCNIDGFLWAEYAEAKILMETKLGHEINFITYPGGQYTAAGEAWLANSANFGGLSYPFLGGRSANHTQGSWTFLQTETTSGAVAKTGCQIMEIVGPNFNTFVGTTDIKKKIDYYLDYLANIGGVTFFYTHNAAEYSLANTIIAAAAVIDNPNVIVGLPRDIVQTIRQQTDLDGTGLRWGRIASVDASDYRLKSSSPCKNAGINVGLTTDFLGKKIRGLPDIGAFEIQLTQQGGGFNLGFGGF